MERVLGIGGYFLRATDPEALSAWYRDCLGLDTDEHGLWRPEAGPTVFAAFESGTDYFGSRTQQTMLNFRVRDLDAMLAQLRAKERTWPGDAGHGGRRPLRLGHRPRGQPPRTVATRLIHGRHPYAVTSDRSPPHSVWNAPSRSTRRYVCAPKKSRCPCVSAAGSRSARSAS